jgi:hypothetical protein
MNSRVYFWSLSIEPGFVQAGIWTIEGDSSRVLAVGPSVSWHDAQNLVEAVDATLSACVADFEEDEEPTKTVFGVPPSWVTSGQIQKEHLEMLREVCSKLSLEPAGFVVLTEAIANFIKSEEETPLNGVVIGVGKETLDIAVFRLGNLAGVVNVGRSDSVVDDVVEGLARFTGTDPVPSRFLLYDGMASDLEEFKQSLIKADWTGELNEDLKFLHTPTVDIIDSKTKTVAVCLAGASEMASVTKVVFPKSIASGEETVSQEEDMSHVQAFTQNISPQDVGFVLEEDIEDNLTEPGPIPVQIEQTLTPNETKGVGKPLKKITGKLKHFKLPRLKFPKIFRRKSSMAGRPISLNPESTMKKTVLTIGAILAVVLVLASVAWWFGAKADVTVYIAPRKAESRANITLNKDIPSSVHEVTVEGQNSADATGRKLVGEQAKGEVEIRNGTGVDIKVNAGTTLAGPNNLKFTLDSEATVPAADSPSSPGSQKVSITAQAIGGESNLGKDETLAVGNYPKSEVDAVVVNGLTGGSSREITAVSQADLTNLEKSLNTELIDQGRQKLEDELADDEYLIVESITSLPQDKEFSAKVGDEASTIKLNMGLKINGLVVKNSDLTKFASEKLASQVPQGFVMPENQIKAEFTPVTTTDDSLVFDTQFIANLLPETKIDEIEGKIAGKSIKGAQNVLNSIPGFVRATVSLSPKLPGRLAIVPLNKNNIVIEITSE